MLLTPFHSGIPTVQRNISRAWLLCKHRQGLSLHCQIQDGRLIRPLGVDQALFCQINKTHGYHGNIQHIMCSKNCLYGQNFTKFSKTLYLLQRYEKRPLELFVLLQQPSRYPNLIRKP